MTKIHWSKVPVTQYLGAEQYHSADATERVKALAEYRRWGSVEGWFLATPAELAETDDGSDLGPAVGEIDWSDFPAVEA